MNKVCLFFVGFVGLVCMVQGLTPQADRAATWPGQESTNRLVTRGTCPFGELPNMFAPLVLKYYGGPTINTETKIYIYYYGKFVDLPTLRTNVVTFVNNLDQSPWYSLTSSLPVRGGLTVTKKVTFGGDLVQTQLISGNLLDQKNVERILMDLINKGSFPTDTNAQYYIMNGDDTVLSSGAQKVDYCGYHTSSTTTTGVNVKIGFVAADANQISGCGTTGPLDDVSNAVIGTLAHEIIETVTDPLGGSGDAGFAGSGPTPAGGIPENADMCDGVTFPPKTLPNGKTYTVYIGPNPYQLFPNMDYSSGCCGFGNSTSPSPVVSGAPASLAASVVPASVSASFVASLAPSSGLSGSPSGAAPTTSASAAAPTTSASPLPPPTITGSPYGTYIHYSAPPTFTYAYAGAYCGNGVVDPGEQCDPGYYSFGGASCCNFACGWKVGQVCGPKSKTCYRTPRCVTTRAGKVVCQSKKPRRQNTPCKVNGATGHCNAHGTCLVP